MYVDRLTTVSGALPAVGPATGQTVTGTNTSVVSTDSIDLTPGLRDIGSGLPYPILHAAVVTAFAGLTSLSIEAIVADDGALTTNVMVIGSSGPIPAAELVAGRTFAVQLNPIIGGPNPRGRRFLGARYTIIGAGSAGALFAHFGFDIQDGRKFYPSGFIVA